MGLLKIVFNMMIFLSSSLIGYLYGGKFNKRAKNILDLEYCVRILETEIIVGNTPLPMALENTYKKGKGKISSIFKIIGDDLIEERREDVYDSFLNLKDELKNKYSLNEEDIEVLMFLGKTLGKTDRYDQEKNFKFVKNQIKELTVQANLDKARNEKLYRSLGVLIGIGIIIIFI